MVPSDVAFETAYEDLEQGQRRPIDLVHLAKQSLGDEGIEQEILRLFNEMIVSHFEGVETSTTLEALTGHLHALRLAAAGAGAWGLARQAGFAEDEIKAGKPVNPEWIDDLEMVVHEVSAYACSLIKDDEAA
jgi:hypothetical protein